MGRPTTLSTLWGRPWPLELLTPASSITATGGVQYLSIRYTDRLTEAGVVPFRGKRRKTPATTLWQRRSTASTKQKLSGKTVHERASNLWSTRPWNGWIGSTIGGFLSLSVIFHPLSAKRSIITKSNPQPRELDSTNRASGEPGLKNPA